MLYQPNPVPSASGGSEPMLAAHKRNWEKLDKIDKEAKASKESKNES